MQKCLITVGMFLVFQLNAIAQFNIQADSIKVIKLTKQLPVLKGAQLVDCLNEISQHYIYFTFTYRRNSQDSVVKFAGKALLEAGKINYKYGYAVSLLHHAAFEINSLKDKKVDHAARALKLIEEALAIANATQNNDLRGIVYRTWGELLLEKGDPASLGMLKKSLDYFLLSGKTEEISDAAGLLCDEYILMGDYNEALEFCEKCLTSGLMKTSKYVAYSSSIMSDALWHLSMINEVAGDQVTALKYLQQAEQFMKVIYGESTISYDIGDLYNRSGQYDSADFYFSSFLNKYPENSFIKIKIGETALHRNSNDKALALFLDAKKTVAWLPALSRNLATAYMVMADFKSAIPYVRSWVNYVNRTKNPDDMLDAFRLQAKYYHGVGRYDSAFTYQQKFLDLKDSVTNKKLIWELNNKLYKRKKAAADAMKASEIALLRKDIMIQAQLVREQALLKDQKEARIQLLDRDNKIQSQQLIQEVYLKEKKEAIITLLNKDNELLDQSNQIKTQQVKQDSIIKKFLFAGLVALMLSGFFIFRNLSLKRKNEKLKREGLENALKVQELQSEKEHVQLQQEATKLEMQALRAQMNPHFIFNCLSSINKYIVTNDTGPASDYLTRFSRLIRMVLVNSEKSAITLEAELDMLRLYLDMERLRFNNSFDYNITFVNAIEPANIFIPPMLLQPFCENAIWHGLMHKKGHGKLDIAISLQQDSLFCTISDNGVGREKAAELKIKSGDRQKSLGLKITNNRLALLDLKKGENSYYDMNDIIDKDGIFGGTQVNFRIRYKDLIEHVNA